MPRKYGNLELAGQVTDLVVRGIMEPKTKWVKQAANLVSKNPGIGLETVFRNTYAHELCVLISEGQNLDASIRAIVRAQKEKYASLLRDIVSPSMIEKLVKDLHAHDGLEANKGKPSLLLALGDEIIHNQELFAAYDKACRNVLPSVTYNFFMRNIQSRMGTAGCGQGSAPLATAALQ